MTPWGNHSMKAFSEASHMVRMSACAIVVLGYAMHYCDIAAEEEI